MTFIRSHGRLLLVAVCSVALGAGVSAIATAGATPSAHPRAVHRAGPLRPFAARRGALRRFAARAVHGTIVVRTRTGFATVSFDRGTVQSVTGQQLTLTEGTPGAAYKTVTLTIPATARVRDNRQRAPLSALKPGQRVIVVQAPKRTLVIAHTRP